MKKIFASLFVVFAVGVAFAAQDTITAQDATKTGLEGFRTKVNANFGRIPATIVTNVTAQTATVSGTVTPQTITPTVAYTYATNIYSCLDADPNAVSYTNITIATVVVGPAQMTNATVTTAGVTTNVTVTRK